MKIRNRGLKNWIFLEDSGNRQLENGLVEGHKHWCKQLQWIKKKLLTHGQQNSLKTCLSFGVNMGEVMSSSKHSFRGEYTINIECGPLETALVWI